MSDATMQFTQLLKTTRNQHKVAHYHKADLQSTKNGSVLHSDPSRSEFLKVGTAKQWMRQLLIMFHIK